MKNETKPREHEGNKKPETLGLAYEPSISQGQSQNGGSELNAVA